MTMVKALETVRMMTTTKTKANTGRLYMAAMPIGNYDDITIRALRELCQADLIAAEDTREVKALLRHHEANKKAKRPRIIRLDEFTVLQQTPQVVATVLQGGTVVYVSDAGKLVLLLHHCVICLCASFLHVHFTKPTGTPGINDPGQRLVNLALEAQIPISALPGPSAVSAIASISGFIGVGHEGFVHTGFVPKKGKQRKDWVELVVVEPRAIVALESKNRIEATLQDISRKFCESCQHQPARTIVIGKDLTKRTESIFRGTIQQAIVWVQRQNSHGEYVMMLSPL